MKEQNKQRPTKRRETTTELSYKSNRGSGAVKQQMSNDELRRARKLRMQKKRKRRKIIAFFIVTLLVLTVGIVLSLTVFFHIETVAVAGDAIYNNEQIIEASQIEIGDNMFLTSKKQTSQNIEKTLPYVASAQIKRNISGTITINVTAAVSKMAIDNGESFVLLSDKGKVLEDGVMSIDEGIIILNASAGKSCIPGETIQFENQDDLTVLMSIIDSLDKSGIEGIASIDITNHSDIKLIYNSKIELKVGSSDSLYAKTDFISATLTRLREDDSEFEGSIDFTIDNKAYLSPKKVESTTTAFDSP